MKKRNSGLRNESSKTKRIGLFQRITAAFPLPLIIIYKKVSSTFLPYYTRGPPALEEREVRETGKKDR